MSLIGSNLQGNLGYMDRVIQVISSEGTIVYTVLKSCAVI